MHLKPTLLGLAVVFALLDTAVSAIPTKREIAARQLAVREAVAKKRDVSLRDPHPRASERQHQIAKRDMFANPQAKDFYVDGSKIPEVDFDVGPSWAGLLPISKKAGETRKLFFWYYPPSKFAPKAANNSLVFWTNGGPGCSSLEGISQENGPWTWPWGTYKPVQNEYSWTNYSHVLWVEQPVGTGYSQGVPNIKNEVDLAKQLTGFFEVFLDVFTELKNKDLYLTGESYAGKYIPYIADYIIHNATTLPLKLKGLMVFDPSLGSEQMQNQIPAFDFVKEYDPVFALSNSQMAALEQLSNKCGYSNYTKTYLKYPPKGRLPTLNVGDECDIWDEIFNEALAVNPAFNVYRIFDVWPILWDVLGFPGSFPNEQSKPLYFNRNDVKKLLHVPTNVTWTECSEVDVFVGGNDLSGPSAYGPLPGVIDTLDRTIIAHGLADYVLIAEGTSLLIQNMTWGGKQGYLTAPTPDNFFTVTPTGNASAGSVHTERKLTYAQIKLSGHMVPQFSPWSGIKLLRFLLGQIHSPSRG